MPDLRDAMLAAAPRPTRPPDPHEIWRRGLQKRRVRLVIAAFSVLAIAAVAWSFAEGGHGESLFDEGSVQPADGDETSVASTPDGSVVFASFDDPAGGSVTQINMTIVDLESGESRPLALPEFNSGDAQFALEVIGGKLVFRGSSGTEAGTYALDTNLEGEPVLLGESWYFVPSAESGRVWLAILDPESPATERGLKAVREVTVHGEVTVDDTVPPPGDNLVGAVNQGLLIQNDGLQVWDPRTDQIVARLDGVFPVDTLGDVVGWCDNRCPELHLTDVGAGEDTVIQPPGGLSFEETYNGAFSPDGKSLAVPVRDAGETRVAIVDIETATVRLIPDSILSPYRLMRWTSSGDWLVFDSGRGYLSAWRPDTQESTTIAVDESQTIFAMAAIAEAED